MKHERLKRLIFMALCCDLGIFAKKLIAPAVNILTDALHVPGGIGTAFSLMFLVLAALFIPRFGAATLMGAVQSGIALCMGTVGSMGALAPLGYILPALAIDTVLTAARRLSLRRAAAAVLANAAAAVTACLVSNVIVFHLRGTLLLLYIAVGLISGLVCGALANACAGKLDPIWKGPMPHENQKRKDLRRDPRGRSVLPHGPEQG